ncbi:MAG: dihydrofolate reductase family protein [Oscillospiraceae bacterium]|nr:dihydrofolate reductase family protein [Oscillospiraceae bacterium]
MDDDPGYGGAHIIEVLGENTPDERLACMRRTGVSYIFAGEDGNDIELALKKLKKYFSVEKLLLEGGSEINGAFQRLGLIDELSLVVAPVTAGEGKPLFADAAMARFELVRTKTRPDGTLWLNYKKK